MFFRSNDTCHWCSEKKAERKKNAIISFIASAFILFVSIYILLS
ncbi:DUF3953 domain-containing protein [Bacillus sp. DJP31]